jgi:menaquinone-dependent protoporphyrinogen oxidase
MMFLTVREQSGGVTLEKYEIRRVTMPKILVTYATKHHSTAEIAEAIAEELRRSPAATVESQPVESVKDIAGYDAVVLGSAVYVGQWQGPAADFLKDHEQELAQRPVWIFSSGPTGEGDPAVILKGWELPEALKPIVDRIKPRDVAVFHGNLDAKKLNLFEKAMVKGVKAPMGDFRNWTEIRAWAANIARELEPMTH